MIPSVSATVTPLASRIGGLPTKYAVRISLPAPSDTDSEWFEFGLAQQAVPQSEPSKATGVPENREPHVEIASASVEGVPVSFQTVPVKKSEDEAPVLGVVFQHTNDKQWITWVKVHVGDVGGGKVQVVYLVHTDEEPVAKRHWWQGKAKPPLDALLDILLPSFALPVGTLEVNIEGQPSKH